MVTGMFKHQSWLIPTFDVTIGHSSILYFVFYNVQLMHFREMMNLFEK